MRQTLPEAESELIQPVAIAPAAGHFSEIGAPALTGRTANQWPVEVIALLGKKRTQLFVSLVILACATAFPTNASASGLRFCNVGEKPVSYRKIALSPKSFGRYPARTIQPGGCGPFVRGFPTTFAFFHKDDAGREYNLVFEASGSRNLQRDHRLKIPVACFDPDRKDIEFVPRAYGETAWLTTNCPDGQLAARTTMTVSGIRGSGQISFNLSVPEILPLSVWYSGKTIAAPVAKSSSIGPVNPASILFKELDRTRNITIDQIPIDAVGSPMTCSEASSRDVLVTIDGTHYDANALLEVYAKVVQLGIHDAITRREMAAASFFADSQTVLGYRYNLEQHIGSIGGGWKPSAVTQFMER